jgi:glycosyltransferase involved in cell wall biosynthesis
MNHLIAEDPGFNQDADITRPRRPAVFAIVPAYNEATRIGKVISVLCQVRSLSEIIVVDDGSTDDTGEEALAAAAGDPRVKILRHPTNLGKGEAMFTGLSASRAPFLLMIDADLVNLKPHHIEDLMEPVLSGKADMTLGLFHHGYWRTDIAHFLTPWLTGQRCLRSTLLRNLSRQAAAGYGFETALTLAARHGSWRCQRVTLVGVTHLLGDIPRGSWRGPLTKLKMYGHILRAWVQMGYWREFVPFIFQRVRLSVLLFVAFVFSVLNSCSVNTSPMQQRLLMRVLYDENFWHWWVKLKAAFDLIT